MPVESTEIITYIYILLFINKTRCLIYVILQPFSRLGIHERSGAQRSGEVYASHRHMGLRLLAPHQIRRRQC